MTLNRKYGWKEFGADLGYDVIGSCLYAAGIYTFASHANFAPGGVSGLAIILNYLFSLPIGVATLMMNIPLIIISYRVLGKTFLLKTVKTTLISAFIMDTVFPLIPIYTGEPILAALYTGALSGAGLALIYMRGSSTGGTDLVIMSIRKKKPHLSIGQLGLAIDGIVILTGGLVYGRIDAVLQGVIATVVSNIVIDKIVYGAGSGKMAMIVTDCGAAVAKKISDETERGATMVDAVGAFTKEAKDLLICACSKREIYEVRRAVYEVDPHALIMITSYDEAYGYGFQEPELSQKKKDSMESLDSAEERNRAVGLDRAEQPKRAADLDSETDRNRAEEPKPAAGPDSAEERNRAAERNRETDLDSAEVQKS